MFLTVEQMRSLNYCWNEVSCRIFRFNKWELISAFNNGLGRLDFHHIVLHIRANFYKHFSTTNNSSRTMLYYLPCGSACRNNIALSLAQLPYSVLRRCIFDDFQNKVNP
jgi:hypothetical protein